MGQDPCRHGHSLLARDGTRLFPTCGCRWVDPPSAKVVTHPSALVAVLGASVEAAERGELPAQKRKAAEGARIEALRERATRIALRAARDLADGDDVPLLHGTGWGRALASIYDELKALGAEEE